MPRKVIRRRVSELLNEFGLDNAADRLFRTYSSGMKKRLSIARALLHEPQVLLMDEATMQRMVSEGIVLSAQAFMSYTSFQDPRESKGSVRTRSPRGSW